MQQQPAAGASQFMAPPCEMMAAFSAPPLAEAASPINSRPPPSGFDELAAAAVGAGNFPEEDDALAAAGEEAERGGAIGNRWPRQETLALLKIRSDMDAAFRDSSIKGPLWEDVSRKLAQLGYNKRSAKKCKEKFENVHKYYKRTKEGRAARRDGKSYRFFTQLEALHSAAAVANGAAAGSAPAQINFSAAAGHSGTRMHHPLPISAVPPPPISGSLGISGGAAAAAVGLSFSSDSSSFSSSDSGGEDSEDAGGSPEGGGRKRKHGGSGTRSGTEKMMRFFEGLTKQVMERQEAMQQRFLETIEKREQDRTIREEAWRRQEMARVDRDQEVLATERAVAANRDNAFISYLQKIAGQTSPVAPQTPHVPPPQPQAQQRPQQSRQQAAYQKPPPTVQPMQQHPLRPPQQRQEARHHHEKSPDMARHQPPATELAGGAEAADTGGTASFDPTSPSSRWPKAEVHALIKVRSGFESRYQDAGPKGPLWEEISAAMQGLGYCRSAKRCKEKWENINKYFKKVKESNKNRPKDAKTCPYFHQLEAIYRKKHPNTAAGGSISAADAVGHLQQQEQESSPCTIPQLAEPTTVPPLQQSPPTDGETKGNNGCSSNSNNGENSDGDSGGSGGVQALNSNGGLPPSSFFENGMDGEGRRH